ncbi:P-loop containing nucleoside triphosphate hydrolase protein [Haematococcus lacustris]
MSSRGAFIVFEGTDRCGKTTQVQKLLEHLGQAGVSAEMVRFPDRSLPSGQIINQYLAKEIEMDDKEVHQLFSKNRWERRQEMLSKLRAGTTLVVDRYAYSGVAYSAAKGLPGLDVPFCKACDEGLLAPDKVLYLKVSIESSAARGGFGQERYEVPEMQSRVQAFFEQLHDPSWVDIQADASIEAVHNQIWAEVVPVLEKAKEGAPLTKLWGGQPIGDE